MVASCDAFAGSCRSQTCPRTERLRNKQVEYYYFASHLNYHVSAFICRTNRNAYDLIKMPPFLHVLIFYYAIVLLDTSTRLYAIKLASLILCQR